MNESLAWYQGIKKSFMQTWEVIDETETEMILKEHLKDPYSFSLRYLEQESNEFIAQFPEFKKSAMTFFQKIGEDEYNEIDLTFQIKKKTLCITVTIDFSSSFITCQVFHWDGWDGEKIPMEIQNVLPSVYACLKKMIMKMPRYRLHVVTGKFTFSQPEGEDWVDFISFT